MEDFKSLYDKTCNTSSPASLGFYCYIWTHSFLRNDQWLPVYHKTLFNLKRENKKKRWLDMRSHLMITKRRSPDKEYIVLFHLRLIVRVSGLSFKIMGRLFKVLRNYLHRSFRIQFHTKHTWKWLTLKLGLKRFYRVQFYRDILLSIHWQEIQNYKNDLFSWRYVISRV